MDYDSLKGRTCNKITHSPIKQFTDRYIPVSLNTHEEMTQALRDGEEILKKSIAVRTKIIAERENKNEGDKMGYEPVEFDGVVYVNNKSESLYTCEDCAFAKSANCDNAFCGAHNNWQKKFKVGDMVRIKEGYSAAGVAQAGAYGEIFKLDKHGVARVKFYGGVFIRGETNGLWWVNQVKLEHYNYTNKEGESKMLNKELNIDDLKTGMVVDVEWDEMGRGNYRVLKGTNHGDIIVSNVGWNGLKIQMAINHIKAVWQPEDETFYEKLSTENATKIWPPEEYKLSKREALAATHTIWVELAMNGNDRKPSAEYLNNCPCCQYVADKHNIETMSVTKCKESCPMIAVWPEGCEEAGSPYQRWEEAAFPAEGKRESAYIAASAKIELMKLGKSAD